MNRISPWFYRFLTALPALLWVAVWYYTLLDGHLGLGDSAILIVLGLFVCGFYIYRLKQWSRQRSSQEQPDDSKPPAPFVVTMGNLFRGGAYLIASVLLVVVEGAFVFLLSFGGNPSPQGSNPTVLLGWQSAELMVAIPIVLLVMSTALYGASFAVSEANKIRLRATNFVVFALLGLFLLYLMFFT
ncbi:MAG: hypothetical protein EP343_02770 [Deltaproteobacteria bacterium]|nr:MAG: hypothetical protein EP343_02770 [Deltaproteobacteria bacterium]